MEREAVLGLGGSVVLGSLLALLWQLLLAPSFAASGQELPNSAQQLQAPSQSNDAGLGAGRINPTTEIPIELAAKQSVVKKEAGRASSAPRDPTMYLTIPQLGLYDHTVRNVSSQAALDLGAINPPSTSLPWQRGDTNTFIVCHRLGFPGTQSYNQCLNLPSMQKGDEVYLKDANAKVYKYRVTEIFAVTPYDTWVMKPVKGRDMVSLQTCIESLNDFYTLGPNWQARLTVRADRVR